MEKKLTRSRNSKVIAGVLGGLGEYVAVDPVLLRLGYFALTIFTGFVPGIIVYILAIAIVPEAPLVTPSKSVVEKATNDTETV